MSTYFAYKQNYYRIFLPISKKIYKDARQKISWWPDMIHPETAQKGIKKTLSLPP
jgi:hypothetical protein